MTVEELIQNKAKLRNLDPNLLSALIQQESGGKPNKVSPKGAAGLMQLMPDTQAKYGVDDPFDPEQNMEAGTKYLSELLQKYNGNVKMALAAYNAGPGAVDKYKGIPPFKETEDYVNNITKAADQAGAKKGSRILVGTSPDGARLRVSVPASASDSEIQAAFDNENKRQQGIKSNVKPFTSDPYGFASEMIEKAPERAMNAVETGVKNIFTGGPLGKFGSGSTPLTDQDIDEMQSIMKMPDGPSKQKAIDQYNAKRSDQNGMGDVPLIGPAMRIAQGKFTPEEADDFAIGAAQSGMGGALSKGTGVRDVAQVGKGIQRGYQAAKSARTPWWRGSLSGIAGMGAGHLLGVNPLEAGAMTAVAASKLPAFGRGFMQGVKEPVTYPFRNAPVDAQFAQGNPYQDIPQNWASRQIPNTADARTSPGTFTTPPPGQAPGYPYGRAAGEIPQGGALSEGAPAATPVPPGPPTLPSGPPGPIQIPQGRPPAIPMGPASQVPLYGNQNVARSPYTGGFMRRQMDLPLQGETSNVPGPLGGDYSGTVGPRGYNVPTGEPSPYEPRLKEAGTETGGIDKEGMESLGKPYTPPLQMTKTGGASEEELQYLGQKLGLNREQLLEKFPNLTSGEPTWVYKGKGDVSVDTVTKEKGTAPTKPDKGGVVQTVTPGTVRERMRVHGESQEQAEKYFRDRNFEIKKSKSLKKKQGENSGT